MPMARRRRLGGQRHCAWRRASAPFIGAREVGSHVKSSSHDAAWAQHGGARSSDEENKDSDDDAAKKAAKIRRKTKKKKKAKKSKACSNRLLQSALPLRANFGQ
jgi:hypothetical protein